VSKEGGLTGFIEVNNSFNSNSRFDLNIDDLTFEQPN